MLESFDKIYGYKVMIKVINICVNKIFLIKYVIVSILLSVFSCSAIANDLDERLKNEVDAYILQINSLSGKELIAAADLITGSGVSDSRLFDVVEKKVTALFEQHKSTPRDKDVARELSAMLRTMGAMSNQSEALIQRILSEAKSRGVRNRAKRMLPKLSWFMRRNEVMQNAAPYQEGQDIMTHRFFNLVVSDDPTLNRWAAEEMFRRGGSEPVVYKAMAEKVSKEMHAIKNDIHLDALAWFCKTLREYDLPNSAALLTTVSGHPNTHKKLRKYSRI